MAGAPRSAVPAAAPTITFRRDGLAGSLERSCATGFFIGSSSWGVGALA